MWIVTWRAYVSTTFLIVSYTYYAQMNSLVSNDLVEVYRPLMDVEGSYSAQFEHVRETNSRHFLTNSLRLLDNYFAGIMQRGDQSRE